MSGKDALKQLTIRWEGKSSDLAKMEVSFHASIKAISTALESYPPLVGKKFLVLMDGKPVPQEDMTKIQVAKLEDIIYIRQFEDDDDLPPPDDKKESGTNRTSKAKQIKAVARKGYNKSGKKRLQFNKGDVLTVLKRLENSPWWWCECNGVKGYAPKTFLTVVEDSDSDEDEKKSGPVEVAPVKGTQFGTAARAVADTPGAIVNKAGAAQIPAFLVDHLESILASALGSGGIIPTDSSSEPKSSFVPGTKVREPGSKAKTVGKPEKPKKPHSSDEEDKRDSDEEECPEHPMRMASIPLSHDDEDDDLPPPPPSAPKTKPVLDDSDEDIPPPSPVVDKKHPRAAKVIVKSVLNDSDDEVVPPPPSAKGKPSIHDSDDESSDTRKSAPVVMDSDEDAPPPPTHSVPVKKETNSSSSMTQPPRDKARSLKEKAAKIRSKTKPKAS
jgi:hypothetical protein